MRWLLIAFYLVFASPAFSFGAIVTNGTSHWALAAYNEPSPSDARTVLLNVCQRTSSNCTIVWEFSATCVAVATTYDETRVFEANAAPPVVRQALDWCAGKSTSCLLADVVCDSAEGTEHEQERLRLKSQAFSLLSRIASLESQLQSAKSSSTQSQEELNRTNAREIALYKERQDLSETVRSLNARIEGLENELSAAYDRGLVDALAIYAKNSWAHLVSFSQRSWASASQLSSDYFNAALATGTHALLAVRDLPLSTHIASVIAAFSLALAGVAWRSNRRREPDKPKPLTVAQPPPVPLDFPGDPPPPPPPITAQDAALPPLPPSHAPTVIEAAPAADSAPVDTPAALRAMAIAHAYLAECNPSLERGADNRAIRTTLALAARQLDIAQKADPNALFEDSEGSAWRLHQIRCRVLLQEALSHAADNMGKACAIAETACLHDPDSAYAHHTAGLLHYEHKNRDAAVAHLRKSVQLDPDDIKARMLLDRAENMTAAEIATYKTQNAGIKVANAGVKVYNAGVIVYNIGIFFWNILVYALRIITLPYRIMDRLFGWMFK